MSVPYRQFCPVAKAMELLDERWTVLVVRELLMGSQRFGELRRGLPRISPSLLSRRLHQLTAAGLVQRRTDDREIRYVLTPAGRELEAVVQALGVWGTRWVPGLDPGDLDASLVLWDMHRNVDVAALPPGRTVVRVDVPDAPPRSRRWWLVLDAECDVCDVDPGYEADLTVRVDLRTLTDVWRGALGWAQAVREQRLVVTGPSALRRALPGWFRFSALATVVRPEPAG